MKLITNIEKLESLYKNWQPSYLAFIKQLSWSREALLITFLCQLRNPLIEWPDISKEFAEVTLKFTNVIDFKLNFSGSGIQQVSGFDITDISNNGLESINFLIEDYESDKIHFKCAEIYIDSVSDSVIFGSFYF